MMVVVLIIFLRKGVRKGEELKALRYASAAATRNYITTRDIIPNKYLNGPYKISTSYSNNSFTNSLAFKKLLILE